MFQCHLVPMPGLSVVFTLGAGCLWGFVCCVVVVVVCLDLYRP